ncbi:MAG: CHAT domain-containing protein, partial [Bacteroidales bacterium]|nr:CHAT domain-containing protein [Bacteroidales bacterium]
VLRNEIKENEILYSSVVPDSLLEARNKLSGTIAAYNKMILDESRISVPDSNKISLWKDAVFNMNREIEDVTQLINNKFPQYQDILRRTDPVPLSVIQRNLNRYETVVDYFLSNQYKDGKRNLVIFLISKSNLEFCEVWLDSLFIKYTEVIRNFSTQNSDNDFITCTSALSYMYEYLVKPVNGFIKGEKLIIIPDEEIAWLPFDAFLENVPEKDHTDYDGLQYLVYNHTISYAYTSSLTHGKRSGLTRRKEVFAFSPDYSNSDVKGESYDLLYGTNKEIESIYKRFRGKKFLSDQASETNFMQSIRQPALFHLAMHSVSDSINSKYSYLLFDTHCDTVEDGKLYNYEISLTRIKSPMVVLSACNSGTGTLYHGEGLMSLARGFILAGATSVIKTAWEVNDETSAAIISRFYYHLSEGKHKDEAMRQAKLDYLKVTPPAYASPYFWAPYEVIGENEPVATRCRLFVLILSIFFMISAGFLVIYFRRRRIFSDRSL